MMDEIRRQRESIIQIAHAHGATNIRVFGSVARGEDTANSDIDFLMDFETDRSLIDLVAAKIELEELLGRKVDVITVQALHPMMRQVVMREAVKL
jgi:predicted nucleotidyltransferase